MIENSLTLNPKKSWLKWRVVFICFLVQNCAMGLVMGSFGPLLASNESHFGVTRTIAATGMSMITLSIGLLSPFAGILLRSFSTRAVLIPIAISTGLAYWGLAWTTSFMMAAFSYAVIGVGVCFLAILAPVTVISRWFVADRAKVLSVVNLPIALFVSPLIVGHFLPEYGREAILWTIGIVFLSMAPLILLMIDRPEAVGQRPYGDVETTGGCEAVADQEKSNQLRTNREIVANPPFWLISFAIGIIAGSGTAFVVHAVPFGVEYGGFSLQEASMLLSIFAGSGIIGALLFGWFADCYGPHRALIVTCIFQAGVWWVMLQATGTPLFILAGVMGVCALPLLTLHGAVLTVLYGAENVSRAMGFSYFLKLPFIFLFAPGLGYIYDKTGSYSTPFIMTSALLGVATLLIATSMVSSSRKAP